LTEILLIDDGSTDGSFRIAQKYSPKIFCETGAHQGGNRARNRGLQLSRGEFIQYLDADDILDRDKLRRQVRILRENRTASAVVGNWALLVEKKGRGFAPNAPVTPRIGPDPICSLIRNELWAPLCAHLYKKDKLMNIGGWDESLTCMQDVDLNLRLLMSGAEYLVGGEFCGFYRRPMAPTTSTKNQQEFMRQCLHNYHRCEEFFEKTGWTTERRAALAQCYFFAARYYARTDRTRFEECLFQIEKHDPQTLPEGPRMRALVRWFGLRNALLLDRRLWSSTQAFKK
jgi:glycosyltransferase involved in cell wall biosynthesis